MKQFDRHTKQRLEHLVAVFCDNRLTDVERVELEGLLQGSESARAFYLRYLDMHLELKRNAPGANTGASDLEHPASIPTELASSQRFSFWRIASYTAAAAALVTLFAVALTHWQQPFTQTTAPNTPSDLEPLAYVTRSENVRWTGPAANPVVGEQIGAGSIELQSGQLRLDLFDGVAVTVHGPAEFSIESADTIELRRGRMAVRAGGENGGVTVNTPRAIFVDVGTEFALHVTDEGASNLFVREGEVVASVLGQSTTVSAKRGEELAISAESNDIKRRVLDDDQFAKMIPPALIPLRLSPAYVSAVRESAPVGYWRFESTENRRVPNEMSPSHAAVLSGPVTLEGTGNRACFFSPEKKRQAIQIDGSFSNLNAGSGYSLEFWINPLNHDWSAIASLVSRDTDRDRRSRKNKKSHLPEPRLMHIECMPSSNSKRCLSSRLFPDERGNNIRLVHRNRIDHPFKDCANAFSQEAYSPGKWHHVVAVCLKTEVRLYFDGRLSASAPVPTGGTDGGPAAENQEFELLIGRYTKKDHSQSRWIPNQFAGRIDEIALYDRPLVAAEISRHFRSAQSTADTR